MQRLASLAGQASRFVEDAPTHATFARDLAHAQVRQAPVRVAALQQGGAKQAVVEASGDQLAAADAVGQQGVDAGIGRQQPVGGIGIYLAQVGVILGGRAADGFDQNPVSRRL